SEPCQRVLNANRTTKPHDVLRQISAVHSLPARAFCPRLLKLHGAELLLLRVHIPISPVIFERCRTLLRGLLDVELLSRIKLTSPNRTSCPRRQKSRLLQAFAYSEATFRTTGC